MNLGNEAKSSFRAGRRGLRSECDSLQPSGTRGDSNMPSEDGPATVTPTAALRPLLYLARRQPLSCAIAMEQEQAGPDPAAPAHQAQGAAGRAEAPSQGCGNGHGATPRKRSWERLNLRAGLWKAVQPFHGSRCLENCRPPQCDPSREHTILNSLYRNEAKGCLVQPSGTIRGVQRFTASYRQQCVFRRG